MSKINKKVKNGVHFNTVYAYKRYVYKKKHVDPLSQKILE